MLPKFINVSLGGRIKRMALGQIITDMHMIVLKLKVVSTTVRGTGVLNNTLGFTVPCLTQ